ncbi:MAG: magnesium/cobalt transporter CorA [Acidimicrobiia bacterium]
MIVDCGLYVDGRRSEVDPTFDEIHDAAGQPGAFVWMGLHEPTADELADATRAFGLHELAVEDALKAHQRPKLEVYDESLFVVLKTARYLDAEEAVEFGEILVFAGAGFVVVVRHGGASPLGSVRKAVEGRPELARCGPGAVLHAIVDRVVDDYAPVIEGLENDIGEVELSVFSGDGANPVERIYKLKREVLGMQQALLPLDNVLDVLADTKFEAVHADIRQYFRDVHDHVVRQLTQVNTFSDLLTSVLSANLTQVSVRQNADMRRISAWVAIAAVPTMVAGIYGMNFEHMPELGWVVGYPLVLAVMIGACALMHRAFRRSGWL